MYDRVIVALTSRWYAEVLARLPRHARLLDVGVGTAGALLAQARLLQRRDLHVVGVDIDGDYVRRARQRVAASPVRERVEIRHESLADHRGGPYDAVYFAASFMLFPDPVGALRDARQLLAPGGRIWFTQTFQDRESRTMERLKPALRRWTGIDFGRVTYEADFFATLEAGGLSVTTHEVLGRTGGRSSRLVAAVPAVQGSTPST